MKTLAACRLRAMTQHSGRGWVARQKKMELHPEELGVYEIKKHGKRVGPGRKVRVFLCVATKRDN